MSSTAGGGSMSPKTGSDPAMDDILASIRRILNEDEAAAAASASAPPPADTTRPTAAEPLELTESMMVTPAVTTTPVPVPEAAPPGFEEASPPPATEPAPATPLVAPAVAAATTAALGQLLRTVAAERTSPVHRGGPTIEDVVREELRPLLKSWLDQHLPPLVERLVRAEIERVVGRAI